MDKAIDHALAALRASSPDKGTCEQTELTELLQTMDNPPLLIHKADMQSALIILPHVVAAYLITLSP